MRFAGKQQFFFTYAIKLFNVNTSANLPKNAKCRCYSTTKPKYKTITKKKLQRKTS